MKFHFFVGYACRERSSVLCRIILRMQPRDPPGVKLRMTGTEIRTEDSPVIIALIWPARPAQGSLNLTPPDSFTGRVAISVTSKRRPPRPRSPSLSPPLHVHHTQTHPALVRGDDEWLQMHRHRIERRAVRAVGGEGAPRIAQEAAGEGDDMRGHGELWRL